MDHEKVLKGVSRFNIGIAVITLLFSVFLIIYGTASGSAFYTFTGIFGILGAVFDAFKGIAGLKVIDGEWETGAVVLGWLGVTGGAISFLISMLSPKRIIIRLIYLVLDILYIYCVNMVRLDASAEEGMPAETKVHIRRESVDDEAKKFFE